LFNSKIKLGVIGRQKTFDRLNKSINSNEKTIWFHCASLGEYEQGFPLFVELKKKYSNHKLVLSFFSPSGYEIKKESSIANIVVYLPVDSARNCKKFLDLINPEIVVFVKSEIWPNYLNEIKKRKIKSILICAVYSPSLMKFNLLQRAALKFEYIFTQDEKSKELFNSIGHNNVVCSGDTRYDRVSLSKNLDEEVKYIKEFVNNKNCLIAGSTWNNDEKIIVDYINNSTSNIKYIIAPHEINERQINNLKSIINKKTILFSKISKDNINSASVIIENNIGTLSKLYKYASLAYIGGGFNGEGKLHNSLEAAVFGLPIVIGKYYSKFPEATSMVGNGGMFSVKNKIELKNKIDDLIQSKEMLLKTGKLNSDFINNIIGATTTILNHLN
jgi:3-deoxy-D-manno-octulosonic-acid transferase